LKIAWSLIVYALIVNPLTLKLKMNEDPRCCGTGTCIINKDGFCWCGQRWDGEKMCMPQNEEDMTNQKPAPETKQIDE
jgi:hypothetical protein